MADIDEHRIYITSAERGERLSCFAHGTNCGHDHLLATAEGDDIDSCEWECAGGETAEPDWPDCWLHGCAPWQCRFDSHDPASYGETFADYGIEALAAA